MAKRAGKNLVIVESPAKAKTINKYLGDDFIVKASMGHVRDLPKKGMGIDLETFMPTYEVIKERGKEKLVAELKKLAKDAPTVYLATDLDREGEAIAWHLKETLGLEDDRVQRVIFNAITKDEIQRAFKNPHKLDIDRVNAQQARRILDRMVGFEISPVLWRKVARGLSAGRVQSVAVRLVVEREREIEAFMPDEYWSISAVFGTKEDPKLNAAWHKFLDARSVTREGMPPTGPNQKQQQKWLGEHGLFEAELVEMAGKKLDELSQKDAKKFVEALGLKSIKEDVTEDPEGKGPAKHLVKLTGTLKDLPNFSVKSIEKKRSTSRPSPPFITSTLQQAGSTRLGFGAQKTMRAAQQLYEAGHITYMRTDSTHISGEELNMARAFISKEFGEKDLPEKPNFYASSNKAAQEAHEAIRPTALTLDPKDAKKILDPDQARIYELIYNRFLSCQMTPAQWDQTVITITAPTSAGDATFRATGRKLVFDGFMRIAGITSEDQILPELAEKQRVHPIDLTPTQHFTQPPPRFTEASLIKDLESKGIGRPSTYASIISTIQDRKYVTQRERRFYSTMLGKVVTDKLIQAFPEILNVSFTSEMEGKLDKIEEKDVDWLKLIKDFYVPFHASIGSALEKLQHAGGMASEYVDEATGTPLVYRISASGFFLASGDPNVSLIKPVDEFGKPVVREISGYKCPKCGRDMIKRGGRFGDFLSCSGYNEKDDAGVRACELIIPLDKKGQPQPPKVKIESTVKCEKCGSPMILRDSKRGPFLGCSTYPKCRSTKFYGKLKEEEKAIIDPLIPELKQMSQNAKALIEKLKKESNVPGSEEPDPSG
ncbi:MAG TPA: type I DNA topoisomerase, partial [Tepidisphaeraceae bacterium]|nr:type I DNA topoisomerase [Tepidisphaeraceae bacterium]